MKKLCLLFALLFLFPAVSLAGHYVHGYYRKGGTYVSPHYSKDTSTGTHTNRDPDKRREFMKEHPCPSTGKSFGACPGYVVDHIQALKHGGADDPSNMQWQTVNASKAKDKWE